MVPGAIGRTVVDSVAVERISDSQRAALDSALVALRTRFPQAILERYLGHVPRVGERVHLAPGAALIGDVTLADDVSVWTGAVLRGDLQRIVIGARSNVQDGAVIHLGDRDPTVVEDDVVIGHRAVLHGCHVGAASLIGIGAIVLDGAEIGAGSLVAAGALVTAGTVVPPRSLVAGVPAKVLRPRSDADEAAQRALAAKYVRLATNHREG